MLNVGGFKQKAFLLLEVVVGTFIFLVILSALQGYWVTVSRMMEHSRARMAAGFLAQELMAKGYEKADEIETSAPHAIRMASLSLMENICCGISLSVITSPSLRETAFC